MTELIGLAFSAVAGICFVSGIAVLVETRQEAKDLRLGCWLH